jgi:hypothetical protein
MAGGTQSTATIENSQPASGDRVRLVLRRHTSWGQSVFLYGSKPGFVCRGNCSIATHVDGRTVSVKAFAPSTGEPALMIRDDKAFIAMLGKEFLLNASEIEWLQASGNYVNLHVRGRDYPLRATMAGIEERLDPARFVRVHRGYFVNLDYLVEIEPLETGDARLQMRDGTKISCSRRYRAALRERFGQPD